MPNFSLCMLSNRVCSTRPKRFVQIPPPLPLPFPLTPIRLLLYISSLSPSAFLPIPLLFPQAKTFLSSSTLDADVQAAYKRAQSLGISGVPFTVIDKRYGVSGAQEIETFTEILEKVVKGEEP